MESKKISQLLLNTSGACFLCLQDNQRDNEEGPVSVEDLNGGIIDLSNICKYLNIDQCSLLLTSLKNDGGEGVEDLEKDACTFSVNLCANCLELSEKLNDVIIKLEKAKLMVNYHLHSFHKILEGANGQWINLQERMDVHLDNSLDAKLVKILREETKEKALKILQKAEAAKPQLILSKCQLTTTSPPPPPSPESPPIPSTILGGTFPSIKTFLSQLVTSNLIFSKTSSHSKLHRCPYCFKIMGYSKFAIHLCCLHSDKLLSAHFPPPSLPPSESLCRQVLQSQVTSKATKLPSSSSSPAPRLGCHLCGITYSDGTLLKHHFLITHTDKLIEYITNFENPPQISKPLKMTASKSASLSEASQSVNQLIKRLMETNLINPANHSKNAFGGTDQGNKRYQCPFCEISPFHSKFAIHLANLHPDKLLDSVTPFIDKREDNPGYFRELCGKVLTKLGAMATKSLVVSTRGGGGTSSSKSSKLCCHLCASKYSDGRHLKHHLIVSHTDQLCEELIKMENDKVERTQDKKKNKDKPLKRLRRSGGAEDKNCLICKQTFSKYDKLQRHMVSLHLEQLFLECKPGGMEDKQFVGICKNILKGEVRRATYGKPGNKIYKCAYCPDGRQKSYKGQDYLEVHLAYQHGEIMEEKLRHDKVEADDQLIIEEEDGSEFDVKPDIGEMDELMYPDMVLDELIDKQEGDDDDKLDPLQQLYGDFEVDDSLMVRNLTEEQVEIAADNQSESALPPIIKMEVNETLIPDDY